MPKFAAQYEKTDASRTNPDSSAGIQYPRRDESTALNAWHFSIQFSLYFAAQ